MAMLEVVAFALFTNCAGCPPWLNKQIENDVLIQKITLCFG